MEEDELPCFLQPVSTTQYKAEVLLQKIVVFAWNESLIVELEEFLQRISKKETTVAENHLSLSALFGQMPIFYIRGQLQGVLFAAKCYWFENLSAFPPLISLWMKSVKRYFRGERNAGS